MNTCTITCIYRKKKYANDTLLMESSDSCTQHLLQSETNSAKGNTIEKLMLKVTLDSFSASSQIK